MNSEPKRAIEYYRQTIRFKPTYTEAYLNMGAIYGAQKDIKKAVDMYERAVATKPHDADIVAHAYVNIGSILTDTKTRLSYYQKAAKAHPTHPQALNNVGMLTQDPKEKEIWFKRAINVAPHFPDPHFNLGFMFHYENTERAAWHYKMAIQMRPGFPQAVNNLAAL